MGAGILLQPAGQQVLRDLDLLGDVATASARIEALHARHHPGAGTLVRLRYDRLRDGCLALPVMSHPPDRPPRDAQDPGA